MKKRSTAIFLAFFTGWMGLHHFYLGNRWRGIIYFTLGWTLMPLIASIIDGLILLTLTPEQFHDFYNLATHTVNPPSEAFDRGNIVQVNFDQSSPSDKKIDRAA